jgi:hypothetical protein
MRQASDAETKTFLDSIREAARINLRPTPLGKRRSYIPEYSCKDEENMTMAITISYLNSLRRQKRLRKIKNISSNSCKIPYRLESNGLE